MYDEDIKTDIALIRQKTEFIEQIVKEFRDRFDSIALNSISTKKAFEEHVIQDRWMFGILVTILVGIFIKMFFN